MSTTLPPFRRARVLVAGDVMLDRYWSGATQRISPEAPVPVVRVQGVESRPGGAANVALNIAALGARASLIGVVGRDEHARELRSRLRGSRVVADLLPSQRHPTISKLRVVSRSQQLIRLDIEEPLRPGDFSAADLLRRFERGLASARAVVLSDYGKGTLADVPALIAAARRAGKPILVDPKGSDYRRYKGATLLTPNLHEFEAVVGPCPDDRTLVAKGHRLCAKLGLQALLVTRSDKGMTLLRRGLEPLQLPAVAREVYDVTGAGDTVIAVLSAALAAGQDLGQAARLSNIAAGIVVGKFGAATVSPDELEREIRQRYSDDAGVVTQASLLALVRQARARGETIVMTNGCFDILHAGHVRYLEEAGKLGDVLIVAVNDDASVKRLKGTTRPVNKLADRMRLLAALKVVDWVVPFSGDTPESLIRKVLPDLLVKGGDYRPGQVAGHAAVVRNGGRVVILGFHKGYSTTATIRSAAKSSPEE